MTKTNKDKPWGKVDHPEVVKQLMADIPCLPYELPTGTIPLKHPYFNYQSKFLPPGAAADVHESTRRFCEALIQWFEKRDLLK